MNQIQILTWWWRHLKSQLITKGTAAHSVGNMNVQHFMAIHPNYARIVNRSVVWPVAPDEKSWVKSHAWENPVVKFEVDTLVGRISNNTENSYQEEINDLAGWHTENNLPLEVTQHQEADSWFFKKSTPVYISETEAADEQF